MPGSQQRSLRRAFNKGNKGDDTPAKLTIRVRLNPDRTQGGEIALLDANNKVLWGPRPALGKAAMDTAKDKGNKGANPLYPFGDTPTGTYAVKMIRGTKDLDLKAYGPSGAIVLDPIGGEALLAEANGRTGLWIHGGDSGTGGGLRRTNGCVRVSNQDMGSLVAAIVAHSVKAADSAAEILTVAVAHFPDDGGDNLDAGDPPPTTVPIEVILP